MENASEEAPFEFKNLLSEMFTSFPNQNPSSCSLEIPKTCTNSSSSSSSTQKLISFGNSEDEDYDKVMNSTISSSTTVAKRSPLQSQQHLLAERKRRERFSQLFAVLAKTIPSHNKLDKASILEDAIKYIGELQERVRVLEKAGTKSRDLIESSATVQKQYSLATTSHNVELESTRPNNHDIKVQILDKNVLIGIHCSKQMRRIFSITAGIMEKLHLTIHHIRVTPSNHTALHYISILAEIDENVDVKVQDVEMAFELTLLSTPNMTD